MCVSADMAKYGNATVNNAIGLGGLREKWLSPTDTRRNNNVIITSKRRRGVVST